MLLGNLYTIYSVKIIVPKELARNCGVNVLSKTSETWQEVCHIDTKEKQRYPKKFPSNEVAFKITRRAISNVIHKIQNSILFVFGLCMLYSSYKTVFAFLKGFEYSFR